MENCDGLYIGRGSRQIEFASRSARRAGEILPDELSRSYGLSHDSRQARQAEAVNSDRSKDANQRTIFKYIHPRGIASCQLVMGFTQLKEGSIWNTMPPHTHSRRTEVYLYFNLDPAARVFHMMGTPQESRHLVVKTARR